MEIRCWAEEAGIVSEGRVEEEGVGQEGDIIAVIFLTRFGPPGQAAWNTAVLDSDSGMIHAHCHRGRIMASSPDSHA